MWNLELSTRQAPIEHTLHAHSRAITDINFAVFHPEMLATCAVDAFVHCWDLRTPARPVVSFSDWFAGATQVKWNRQDQHIIASSHDKYLRIWDDRKGALPLKTIEAHETKIYGIDWNRTKASKIITCSLDCTVKLWDYDVSEAEPERVIQTPYPVWRARHTPFGCGVLAMPQRGNNNLHMYDRRPENAVYKEGSDELRPNYTFTGHREQAKEFLWRARGTIDNNTDDRDFQLVTWGADRELILHKLGPRQLQAVGFHKGMHLEENWELTRRGSPYRSFRETPPTPILATTDDANQSLSAGMYSGTSPGMSKAPIPVAGGWGNGDTTMTYSGMETRNSKNQDKGLINWMKGVRFGKRGATESERRKSRKFSVMTDMRSMDVENLPENLSDEIIHVGERFTKVTFEEADVSTRHVRVSLNGPWAPDGRLAFLQLRLDFPQDYPEASPPTFQLEHTSSLPEKKFVEIENGLRTIAAGYLVHRRGCLEAVLSYLLGERDIQESTDWLTRGESPGDSEAQEESSSDEEDALLGDPGPGESQNLEMEDSMGSGILGTNTNVPLPRKCSALWAPDGRLVCFFPPKEEQRSMLQHVAFGDSSRPRSGREIFEGFGRLHTDSPDLILKNRNVVEGEIIDSDGSDAESSTSSSSSSSSSGGPDMLPTHFQPPAAWHGGSLRIQKMKTHSTDGSLPTSNGLARRMVFSKNKTIIALHTVDDVLPSKRDLAQEYLLFGEGQALCAHNSGVALKHELPDIADIWGLIGLILTDSVPLSLLSINGGSESVAVLAQRALVRINRIDSGLDLSFDEPNGILDPHERSLVKWGNHPFSGNWLVQRLFDHFEKIADVQMLAMLSCVFAQSSVERSADQISYLELPISMKLPAQARDYFPTMEAALGYCETAISSTSSPPQFKTPGTTYGSIESSAFRNSDPATPFSTSATPPMPPMPLSRGSTLLSVTQSLSTSPDRHRVSIPSAHSSFAASMWSRPFNLASSPPTRQRLSGEDMSSYTPPNDGTTGAKGTRNVFRSDSTIRTSYMAHGLTDEYDCGSSTEEDEPSLPMVAIKLNMKNQDLFDGEATASVPILHSKDAHIYAGYREAYAHMLGAWGMALQRNEVLKYNGIVSTTSGERGDRNSQSTLTLPKPGLNMDSDDSLGLHIARCCTKCSRVDTNGTAGRLETMCSRCNVKYQIMPCTVCLQPIYGLYKVCLSCGHAAHDTCLHLLLDSLPDDELQCESGCGCDCKSFAVVDSEEIDASARDSSDDEVADQWRESVMQVHQYGGPHFRSGSVNLVDVRRVTGLAARQETLPPRPGTMQFGRRRSFLN